MTTTKERVLLTNVIRLRFCPDCAVLLPADTKRSNAIVGIFTESGAKALRSASEVECECDDDGDDE